MNNKEKDYIFYVGWENSDKKGYKIGLLAKIDNYFYLKMNTNQNSLQAYEKGCIGLPGFKDDRVYRSENLFDFFAIRILEKGKEDLCKELLKTKGRSFVDSFYIEEVPKKLRTKCKNILLNMYKNQEELREVNSHNINTYKETDTNLRAN